MGILQALSIRIMAIPLPDDFDKIAVSAEFPVC